MLPNAASVPPVFTKLSDGAARPPGVTNSYRCAPPLVSVMMPSAPNLGVAPNAIAKPPVSEALLVAEPSVNCGVVNAATPKRAIPVVGIAVGSAVA